MTLTFGNNCIRARPLESNCRSGIVGIRNPANFDANFSHRLVLRAMISGGHVARPSRSGRKPWSQYAEINRGHLVDERDNSILPLLPDFLEITIVLLEPRPHFHL